MLTAGSRKTGFGRVNGSLYVYVYVNVDVNPLSQPFTATLEME